jgi:hypothetical protein
MMQPASRGLLLRRVRCIIPIKPENIEAWLNPSASSLDAMYAVLDNKDRPYYEHKLAA